MLKLSEWTILKTQDGFDLSEGSRTHRVIFCTISGENFVCTRSYLWSWLPYNINKGRVSHKSMELIRAQFSICA